MLGRADSEIRVTGSVRSPTLDGWVTFSNGEARIANPRLVVSDVTGTVTLAADTVTFERIFASLNGGDSEIAGTLRHHWFTLLGGRITMVTNGPRSRSRVCGQRRTRTSRSKPSPDGPWSAAPSRWCAARFESGCR